MHSRTAVARVRGLERPFPAVGACVLACGADEVAFEPGVAFNFVLLSLLVALLLCLGGLLLLGGRHCVGVD